MPPADDLAPFTLVETSPGTFSLLLTEFEGASAAFEQHDIEAGGYAWEGIARHVLVEHPELAGRFGLDPEASMFCAYGTDRDALVALGEVLAKLYRDPEVLAAIIGELGPEGFED